MAGDWIKMRGNLWDDPRVAAICDATGASEAAVIGALYWLWATADQHTEDGCMPGLTTRQIDRKTGVQGFGAALIAIGWLADDPQGVVIRKFEEHNGSSAKRRCSEAQRKANARSLSASDADTEQTYEGQIPPSCGAREERREEKIEKTKKARKRASFDAGAIELPEWLDRDLWLGWVSDRSARGKPITERGAAEQIKAMDGYRKLGHTPERVIAHAIASGHQGLFPPPVMKGVVQQFEPRPVEVWKPPPPMTPEEKAASDKARELALSAFKIITKA